MPGSYGFTGQRADVATGLDYYGARYYDSAAGQFASADSVLPGGGMDILGLSRFAYVGGNPVARTDPTGHFGLCEDDNCIDPIPPPPMPPPPDPVGGGGDSGGLPCEPFCGGPPPPAPGGGDSGAQPTPSPGPSPTPPSGTASVPVLSGLRSFIDAFTAPAPPETRACEPDGPCYHWYSPGYQECVQGGRCSAILRGGVDTNASEPTLTFDQAREEAFKRAGMTDPEQVKITKYDPETGTAVEFSGPNGAKVVYDGPHAQPGPGHDYPHIGWQTGGKRAAGGAARGNIPYKGPAGPVRGSVRGWEEWWPVDEVLP
jgi:RHS repeat-associated protein